MKTAKLDLDGVIVNFTKGVANLFNKELPKNSIIDGYDLIRRFDLNTGQFYSAISKGGEKFWTDLEPYPWAGDLIKIVNHYTAGRWTFLTKTTTDPECFYGKAKWLKKHFPKHFNKLTITHAEKSFCCMGANDVLIDDSKKNIDAWIKTGGTPFFWLEVTEDYDIKDRLKEVENFLK